MALSSANMQKMKRMGSGLLIGPHIVLTAAHNAYDNEKPLRKSYSDTKFIPGANGVEIPFGEIEVDHVFAPESYINYKRKDEENGMNADDYVLLVLTKRIGQETGYFGMYAVSDSHGNLLKPKEVSIVGYAADLIKKKIKNNISIRAKKRQLLGFISKNNYFTFNAMQIYLA